MTEAERALLLWVAEYQLERVHPLSGKSDLWKLIAAVEAEAALADDEAELAEVAEKARAIENMPPPEYLQALLDGAQAVRAALDGDVAAKTPPPSAIGASDDHTA